MDQFLADFHVHSRYSRAVSKSLSPANLAAWAAVKGLDVVATGDFTHPKWFEELSKLLEFEEKSGLYRLKDARCAGSEINFTKIPDTLSRIRFIVNTEISSIYKKGGRVRKIHNLVFMPTLEDAARLSVKLARIGNLNSDGRPILGLDARHLLEMTLETAPEAYIIPAHIWTPWFSLFGSNSGFDAIEDCFEDLSREIFALETGLSSDPEMNRLLSQLDRFQLVSNSDAHSGENLGREANIFSGDISYSGIYRALRSEGLSHKFLGTVEFYPEEGKYHLDGHRKCKVVLEPRETLSRGGICPVCGESVTVGVLNRVLSLADRKMPVNPPGKPGFISLIPLAEIISEVLDCGKKTKKTMELYSRLIDKLGSEIRILREVPAEEIGKISPLLAEAIRRMRAGRTIRQPGYDGEYGRIFLFSPNERMEFRTGRMIGPAQARQADIADSASDTQTVGTPDRDANACTEEFPTGECLTIGQSDACVPGPAQVHPKLNEEQEKAVRSGPGPVLVLAGPGTGKTGTLIGRIIRLLEEGQDPSRILAVTFTRRAAEEIRKRISQTPGILNVPPQADTLHALAFDLWTKIIGKPPVIISEETAFRVFESANPGIGKAEAKKYWELIGKAREAGTIPGKTAEERPEQEGSEQSDKPGQDEFSPQECLNRYTRQKADSNLADYTDLLEFTLTQTKSGVFPYKFNHVLVDEIQDLAPLQLEIVKSLADENGNGFFGIGDVRQSIYGFRGASMDILKDLKDFWPGLKVITLTQNYRSAPKIIAVSQSLFPQDKKLEARNDNADSEIYLFSAPDEVRESSWIGEKIRELIGGTAHWQQDLAPAGTLSPGDVAILVRLKAMIRPLEKTLRLLGIPVSAPEEDVFWSDVRVASILKAAERFLGIADEFHEPPFVCPDSVLAGGPMRLASYLRDIPPFDRLFWQGRAFNELRQAYKEHGGWTGVVNATRLQAELEAVANRSEHVRIMTMHAAKGLEFEAVFLPGLEDGIIPFAGMRLLTGKAQSNEAKTQTEEERRLFYVGMTRAARKLYLSSAAKREVFGRTLRLKQSRFLDELPSELIRKSTLAVKKLVREKRLTLL